MRSFGAALALVAAALAAPAAAQAPAGPTDPYASPRPPPAAPTPTPADRPLGADDPALAEQVARALVDRAQELYDDKIYVEAKQLAVEALVKSSRGAAAEQAKFLIRRINAKLGIVDAPPPPIEGPPPADPIAPGRSAPAPRAAEPGGDGTWALRVHGGLYGGLLGASLGAALDQDGAAGASIAGVVGGAAGALLLPRLAGRAGWSEAQWRTVGAGSVWGGVIGGLFADAIRVEATTARGVLGGAALGSTLGALAGAGLARADRFTRGDVALIDTLAGVGAAGGLTLGMLMQPAEGEAYSVNAILGAAGGVLVGYIAAPQTNTTVRRMLRVAGVAALGGGVPLLLYAGIASDGSTGDERLVGALSTAGLLGGLYLGFRWTRGMDAGADVRPGAAPAGDVPAALVTRDAAGRWAPGGFALQPLSRALAPQPGLALPVVGGSF